MINITIITWYVWVFRCFVKEKFVIKIDRDKGNDYFFDDETLVDFVSLLFTHIQLKSKVALIVFRAFSTLYCLGSTKNKKLTNWNSLVRRQIRVDMTGVLVCMLVVYLCFMDFGLIKTWWHIKYVSTLDILQPFLS